MESETRGLQELIQTARRSEVDIEQSVVKPEELVFDPEGLWLRGKRFPLDQSTRSRLFQKVGAPGWYLRKHGARFQMAALTEHLNRGDFGKRPKLVMKSGKLLTIANGELIDLSTSSVLSAAGDTLGTKGETLTVSRLDRSDERFEVEMVSASKAIIVRAGDLVRAGISIIHFPYGDEATIIQPFTYRLVCENGMVRRECDSRAGMVRTRRLSIDHPGGREVQLDQIRKLTQQSWNGLQPQLEALRATSDRQVNVQELLANLLQRARMSRGQLMPRLLAAWAMEGSDNSQFAAVNALTRVATHDSDLSYRQRRILASLGGLLAFSAVHLCPRCYSLLATGHARSDAPESDGAGGEPLIEIPSSGIQQAEVEAA